MVRHTKENTVVFSLCILGSYFSKLRNSSFKDTEDVLRDSLIVYAK